MTDDNTRYYFDGKHYMKLTVDYDEWAEDPRKIWDVFSNIWIYASGYTVGDNNGYDDVYDALHALVRDSITTKQLISFIRRGKTRMSVDYDRHERVWKLYSKYTFNDCFGHKKGDDCYVTWTDQTLDWLEDDMIDELTPSECVAILEEYADMIFMSVDFIDYGCYGAKITFDTDGFDDCNGIAFTDKKTVTDCMLHSKNWKKHGYRIMEGELKDLNMWVEGNVYYGTWEQYNWDNREFEEVETCGGFFSDNWGEDLFNEIADTNATMYDDFEDLYKGRRTA